METVGWSRNSATFTLIPISHSLCSKTFTILSMSFANEETYLDPGEKREFVSRASCGTWKFPSAAPPSISYTKEVICRFFNFWNGLYKQKVQVSRQTSWLDFNFKGFLQPSPVIQVRIGIFYSIKFAINAMHAIQSSMTDSTVRKLNLDSWYATFLACRASQMLLVLTLSNAP